MKKLVVLLILLLISLPIYAWDGTDTDTGCDIEIEDGNLVRSGNEIEIYDRNDGEYHNVEVESIDKNADSVELTVYDSETDEHRTFEMESNSDDIDD